MIRFSVGRLAGLAILAAAPATALAAQPAQPDVIAALKACRAITGETERLACYDRAAESVTKAQESGEVIIIDRQAARAARKQAFGLDLSALSILDRKEDKAETEQIEAVIKTARTDAEGRLVMTLEDGAVWRQIDGMALGKPPKTGSNVSIRKASMGSYFMKVENQPAIRVRREGGMAR